jgi:hypothetical protein
MPDQTDELRNQPATPQQKRKPAAPRNDFESAVLYKNSRALDLQNRDPGYVYEAFSTDPESPAYIGKRLVRHERGSAISGFVQVEPWEVVHSQTDKAVRALDPREDQGKPVDTVMRYGRQIMCRIRREEHAKYQVAEEAGQRVMERQLYEPDQLATGNARMTAVVSRDDVEDKMDLLRRSGAQLPGG